MNTIGSVYYGWAFLIVCGGGSYYFAKRSINADRASRQAMENEKRFRQNRQLAAATHHPPPPPPQVSKAGPSGAPPSAAVGKGAQKHKDLPPEQGISDVGSPGVEAQSGDPAPTRPAPKAGEKSKFESSEPYRSKRGDRFSNIGKES